LSLRIESERYHKATGKIEREIRYYITSLSPDAARLNSVIRQHWGIENKLHWVLVSLCFLSTVDQAKIGHHRALASLDPSVATVDFLGHCIRVQQQK